jgi:hypothetical protein
MSQLPVFHALSMELQSATTETFARRSHQHGPYQPVEEQLPA